MNDRRFPLLTLEQSQLESLLILAFPGAKLESQELIAGGAINTIYRLTSAQINGNVALRIFQRDKEACAKETRLLTLLGEIIPVPEVFYAECEPRSLAYPFAITSWCPGVTLATALSTGAEGQRELGHSLGETLADIGTLKFETAGRLNVDLSVTPWKVVFGIGGGQFDPASEMISLLNTYLGRFAGRHLGNVDSESMLHSVARLASLLPRKTGEARLVHGDFSPENILVSGSSAMNVTGVIDWEWAHAGSPMFDVANLFRERGILTDEFARAFEFSFVERGGKLDPEWRTQALLVDLVSLLEMIDFEGPLTSKKVAALSCLRRSLNTLEASSR